jgi:predicted transcriptional regulator
MSGRALQIDAETNALLSRLAKAREAEPESIVADAIRLFDELYGEAALAELDRRWVEYERTGESYSQEEVGDWLKTWSTPDHRPFRRRP